MQEAVIGGLGTIVGALIGAWAVSKARTPTKAHVDLVDASLILPEMLQPAERASLSGPTPELVIDVKLLNSGGQTAYVHALSLELSEIIYNAGTEMPRIWDPEEDVLNRMNLQEWSARYGVYSHAELVLQGLPRKGKVAIPLSQELKSGSVDRVCLDWSPPTVNAENWPRVQAFKARVSVTYNATQVAKFNKTLESPVLNHPLRATFSHLLSTLESLLAQCHEEWTPHELQILSSRQLPSDTPRLLKWRGYEMDPLEAIRRCLDAHEQRLRELIDSYVAAGGSYPEQLEQLQEEISELPRLRRQLGVAVI
ncbi:hypothetical protein [Streptomyces sp. NP-1717]|uniref:hypothetical protein n=1 Tax=Streptomyces sp. NP-1717 TaxID=2704470 RepID=UPI001F5D596D|nr:hypothetical protein [Streptomyces sp. NP-1717]MCI3220876.1 hypothetical protein [Streptomyces sp. NP-1717]